MRNSFLPICAQALLLEQVLTLGLPPILDHNQLEADEQVLVECLVAKVGELVDGLAQSGGGYLITELDALDELGGGGVG